MPRLTLFLVLFCGIAAAQSSGIILAASPAGAKLSQPVALTAVITPPPPSGKVTFYDGAAILGVATLDGAGVANFIANHLPAGPRSLSARTWADGDRASIASNRVTVTITATAAVTFTHAAGSPFSLGLSPFPTPVAGDFNGDGHLDFASLDDNGGLVVWEGSGRGDFHRAGPNFDTRATFGTPVTADFNGDDKLDLAVTSNQSVFVFLGAGGEGKFQAAPGSPIRVGDSPTVAAVGDFDGDGKPDLAVCNHDGGAVTILLGDGSGGFKLSKAAPGTAPSALGIGVGDFNGDGNPDLAVVYQEPTPALRILLGDGKGGFSPSAEPAKVGFFSFGLVIADFDGDGKLDAAVASQFEDSVITAFGNGSGGFDPTKGGVLRAGISPQSLATADFNGDGLTDLAVANVSIGNVTILTSDGRGKFLEPKYSPVPLRANGQILAGDFNEDGADDLIGIDYFTGTAAVLQGSSGLTLTSDNGVFGANRASVFRLTVTNRALVRAEGVVLVNDHLPSSITPRSAEGSGWDCSVDGQDIACVRSDSLAPGDSYPQLVVVVDVAVAACPTVVNVVELIHSTRSAATFSTPVSGCFQVSQRGGPFTVNQPSTYTVQVNPIATLSSTITLTDVLPAGLTPATAFGDGWTCAVAAQNVTCLWQSKAPASSYPPITIGVNVGEAACRTSPNGGALQNLLLVQASDGPQETFPSGVGTVGCLLITTPGTFSVTPGRAFGTNIVVTSASSLRETIVNAEVLDNPVFSAPFGGCGDLNPGSSCGIALLVEMPCLGQASGTLTLTTATGSTYKVPLKAISAPQTIGLLVDGRAAASTVNPGESHTLSLQMDPALNSTCEQPRLVLDAFTPGSRDENRPFWDNSFDGKTLKTGTVAGGMTFRAVLTDAVGAQDGGSAVFRLSVPPSKGVVTDLSITNQTNSSFQVDVKGFSTPRETGDNAKTAVCVEFIAANGATVTNKSQPCALQSEIEIWYERIVSYQYGSQFSGSIIYTFTGDTSAIDTVKTWIRNVVGDGTPVCVNLKTGQKGTCPN